MLYPLHPPISHSYKAAAVFASSDVCYTYLKYWRSGDRILALIKESPRFSHTCVLLRALTRSKIRECRLCSHQKGDWMACKLVMPGDKILKCRCTMTYLYRKLNRKQKDRKESRIFDLREIGSILNQALNLKDQ